MSRTADPVIRDAGRGAPPFGSSGALSVLVSRNVPPRALRSRQAASAYLRSWKATALVRQRGQAAERRPRLRQDAERAGQGRHQAGSSAVCESVAEGVAVLAGLLPAAGSSRGP
ncbi:hypothetical protein ABZ686_11670 [Streptomyces sp. NPDC006992]|uniref:hypothetical protein n=1 Tax=Streptomyces sp. NPDC006992 TaxID=3155601 RepID=UPI0033E67977